MAHSDARQSETLKAILRELESLKLRGDLDNYDVVLFQEDGKTKAKLAATINVKRKEADE